MARMYDPDTARFLQEDSYRGDVYDPLSLNLYAYCKNEPMMYTDPTGHSFMDLLNKGKELVSSGINYVKEAASNVWSGIKSFASDPLGWTKNKVSSIRKGTSKIVSRIDRLSGGSLSKVNNKAKEVLTKIKNIDFGKVGGTLKKYATPALDIAVGAVTTLGAATAIGAGITVSAPITIGLGVVPLVYGASSLASGGFDSYNITIGNDEKVGKYNFVKNLWEVGSEKIFKDKKYGTAAYATTDLALSGYGMLKGLKEGNIASKVLGKWVKTPINYIENLNLPAVPKEYTLKGIRGVKNMFSGGNDLSKTKIGAWAADKVLNIRGVVNDVKDNGKALIY